MSHDQGNSTGTGAAAAAAHVAAASPGEATASSSATSAASTASTAAAGGELELQRSRDIKKNLIHCAELKKHNTRFYSEVLRKKFFVLYEDSRRSVTNPRDHTAAAAAAASGSNEDQRPSDVSLHHIGHIVFFPTLSLLMMTQNLFIYYFWIPIIFLFKVKRYITLPIYQV